MKTISKNRAIEICSHWHGGQHSALYQFLSSGIFHRPNILWYLFEVENDLQPEFKLHPGQLTRKDERELKSLKSYFIKEAKREGVEIGYKQYSIYGYSIPYIKEGNEQGIECLKVLI